MGQKIPFWQFFRKGWDGRALLVRPSKMHHSIWIFCFVLGANKYLERLEAKLESAYSFLLKYSKMTVCGAYCISNYSEWVAVFLRSTLWQPPFYLVKIIAHCAHLYYVQIYWNYLKGEFGLALFCRLFWKKSYSVVFAMNFSPVLIYVSPGHTVIDMDVFDKTIYENKAD